jgi:twitching motility protein PilT
VAAGALRAAQRGCHIMATLLIDKLLQATVKQDASDLHLAVGQPPVLRIHGRLQKLKTKVLEPEDTVALMKSITPDRCQQELQEQGGTTLASPLATSRDFASRSSSRRATWGWSCG